MVTRRTYFRWHQRVGLAIGLFAAVIALSGVILVFRGQLKTPPPRAPRVRAPVSIDELVAAAVAAGDGAKATDVALPQREGEAYAVWLDDDDERVVYLDGAGTVLEIRATAGGFTRVMFQIHTGELIGLPGQGIALGTGLGLCVLTFTGLAMILSRRRKRAR